MEIKQRVECMDGNCRTVVTGPCLDELSCPECGGPTLPKPFTAKEIVVPVNIDATKVLEMIKKITNVTNELTNKEEPLLQIVQSDINSVPVVLYKGGEIEGEVRVSFDWKTNNQSGPYIHIEHVDDITERINTKIIQHNHPIVGEVLSKFSTEELIEVLTLKEDVQVHNTTEDTYKVSMNLMEVKKHVLVINNCNPQLVEHRRRVLDAEMIRFAGSCCD
ncbi:hypothetical protein [Bacillus mycoides]|uniref:hypothetical protein n=1 Tax=Bacillus mycoides TaxID=1405 RepID=UPI002E21B6DD|nr:hypothetical protein [Bacillus mycoides]